MAPAVQQKKKGKMKSSSHKASAGKLANKKTSRLAKQGKLNKADKKKKKKQLILDKRSQEQQAFINEKSKDPEQEDFTDEESELSDGETDHFQHLQHAEAFAQMNLINESIKARGKKRKKDSDDEEEEYEQQPRIFASEKKNENMKMLLPIISKGKVIKQMAEKKDVGDDDVNGMDEPHQETENDDHPNEETEPNSEEDGGVSREEEESMLENLTPIQLFAYRKHKIVSMKQRIASLAQGVVEDPQNNMKKLKDLRLMLGDSSPGVCLTVRKYATVSLMEVFKDIVPGYRLRIPTEKEAAQRVKKETKSLWDYEASFLLSYRIYLTFLELMTKGKHIPEKSFLTKHGINNLSLPKGTSKDFSKLSFKCLCEMLVNHPHFNYRDNIISTIVPFMNHEDRELSSMACEAVTTIFKQDKQGDITLEIVKAVGRMAKKMEFDLQPQVLQTFLVLKIKEIDLSTPEEKKKMLKKEKMQKFSRRERKRLKQKEQLDKELLETKAAADRQQKLKFHTEIIQAVFETYIRVIKLAADSVLLPAVLEGLAKFAHLINIDYFDSLFSALNGLIESQVLTDREMLHCMQTAFTILSGQGTVLNIDPSRFYKHFYGALLSVHAGQSSETTPIVLECLHTMIHRRRKQMSLQRVLAFIKRLSTLCLQQSSESSMGFLAAIRQFVQTYKYSDILFDTEAPGTGVYLPELQDPEHCCANSTSLWELLLLRRHYDPNVQKYTQHMLHGAPLAGEHQLKNDFARKSPLELYEAFATRNIFSEQIPEKSPKKRKIQSFNSYINEDFGTYVESTLQRVPESMPSQLYKHLVKKARVKT